MVRQPPAQYRARVLLHSAFSLQRSPVPQGEAAYP